RRGVTGKLVQRRFQRCAQLLADVERQRCSNVILQRRQKLARLPGLVGAVEMRVLQREQGRLDPERVRERILGQFRTGIDADAGHVIYPLLDDVARLFEALLLFRVLPDKGGQLVMQLGELADGNTKARQKLIIGSEQITALGGESGEGGVQVLSCQGDPVLARQQPLIRLDGAVHADYVEGGNADPQQQQRSEAEQK